MRYTIVIGAILATRLAFLSDLRGNVALRECPSNPLGGVANMATYVKEARTKEEALN